MTPGDRVRERRRELGLTTAQLGEKVGLILRGRAVSESTVRNHENSTNGISLRQADAYATALGTTAEWILLGRESEGVEVLRNRLDVGNPSIVHHVGFISGDWIAERTETEALSDKTYIVVDVPGFNDLDLFYYTVCDDTLLPVFPQGSKLIFCESHHTRVRYGSLVIASRILNGVEEVAVRLVKPGYNGDWLHPVGNGAAPPVQVYARKDPHRTVIAGALVHAQMTLLGPNDRIERTEE